MHRDPTDPSPPPLVPAEGLPGQTERIIGDVIKREGEKMVEIVLDSDDKYRAMTRLLILAKSIAFAGDRDGLAHEVHVDHRHLVALRESFAVLGITTL